MRTLTVTIFTGLVAAAAPAANLIQNGAFDTDVSEWDAVSETTIEHISSDELGSPLSGSLLAIAGDDGDQLNVLQCVQVVPNRTYALGAAAFIPLDQPPSSAGVLVSWFNTDDCTGDVIGGATTAASNVFVRGAWGTTQRREVSPVGARSAYLRLRAAVQGSNPPALPLEVRYDNVFFLEDTSCAPTSTTLCLNHDRFRITVEWRTEDGEEGYGQAVKLTDDSGYYWFFNSANVELVVKLLDGCPTAIPTFWFFAAGLTHVQTTVRVRDTQADVERTYTNPLNNAFAPIQDTEAFDTCP